MATILAFLLDDPRIEPQELLLQHLFWGCNCIYKHFIETKKVLRCFRTFAIFFMRQILQESEQNLININSVKCHRN